MGLRFREIIEIKLNGTALIIGEIEELIIPANTLSTENNINLEITDSIGISGLNSYYSLTKINDFPFVRVNEVPSF